MHGCGEARPGGAISGVDKLEAPENFVVRQQNQSNLLSWKQIEGLTYTIYWSNELEVPTDGSQRLDNVNSPYIHDGLVNGLTYYYVIRASQNGNVGLNSSTESATPDRFSKLSKPENVQLKSGNGEVNLTWNRVSGASNYKIYWTTDVNEDPFFSNNTPLESPSNSYHHTNLENDVTYYYVITALAFEGESDPTEKRNATPGFIRPGIPTNLEIHEFGDKSVTIEWSVAENATQYKIYWNIGSPDFELSSAKSGIVIPGENDFILHGLVRGNIYYVKIVGINDQGEGFPSESLKVDFSGGTGDTDLSVIPPTNIEIAVVGVSVSLQWESANTRYNYLVYYATESGITKENIRTKENFGISRLLNQPIFSIDNLYVGRNYYVIIVAILGDKESVESSETSFSVEIPIDKFENSDIQNGAALYTQWWSSSSPPQIENPIWQDAAQDAQGNKNNPSQKANTWRCAECHGWDYLGKDGEYGVGSENFTNFPGLLDAATNKTKEEVYTFIRNGLTSKNRAHSFKELTQQDTLDLTRFIMSEVPKELAIWQGNVSIGETVYTQKNSLGNACQDSSCHEDLPNLESEKKLLLESAIEQPARFIHYVRFGVGRMPGGQSLESAQHVLSYLWQESLNKTINNFQPSVFAKTGSALFDQWAKGGLLYDRWWKAITVEKNPQPLGNHPLWPSNDTVINGVDTWRCKECHGWDYLGKDGVYGRGKHFTGIAGIIGPSIKKKTAQEIYDFLKTGSQHAYSRYLTDEEIYALTRLVLEIRKEAALQQSSVDLIDQVKQEPIKFSSSLGESLYHDSIAFGGCITCHIVEDFGWYFSDSDPERDELQTLDSIAKNNPWEFIHKIRYGHPGTSMQGIIQFESTSPEAAIDILGYVQTALAPNIKRGGRLYDNWWIENGLNKPTLVHELWPSDAVVIRDEETWRCVNCHGWDYKGEQGIKGVLDKTRNIKSFIENGTYLNSSDHSFSEKLKRQDIYDLTTFIESTENTGARSDIDVLMANADAITGKTHYISTTPGNCINCHGESGTSIPNIDLETAAKNFSTRFIHKARFGSPGSIMLPSLERFKGLSATQAADVHAYASNIASSTTVNGVGLDRGGRLFDNWFKEMKAADDTVEDPVLANPLWELRNTGIPDTQSLSDSWRCVSCHSWNYKGIDLLSNDTDADNLLFKLLLRQMNNPNQTDLVNYFYDKIKNGFGDLHNYGNPISSLPTVLGDRELKELALFVTQGVIDTSEYIGNIDAKVIGGDVNNGKALYTGLLLEDINCGSCHGESGDSIPPGGNLAIDIFALANTNPWKFLHKVRFASSGTDMPSLIGLPGTNFQQALDVLSFAQEEFAKRP